MQDLLGHLNLSLDVHIPFDGEPKTLGTPTFEGEEGRKASLNTRGMFFPRLRFPSVRKNHLIDSHSAISMLIIRNAGEGKWTLKDLKI
jgi:hypothetical protein